MAISLPIRLVFVGLGLDFILVRKLLVSFCFLPSFSGIGFVGGVLVLEVCAVRVELADGVICRDLKTDDDFFVVFLYVGFRIFCESICVVSIHAVYVAASFVTHDLAAATWRSIGGCTGGDGKSFAGVLIHLLVSPSCCTLIPLVGSLFVVWGWPVRRPVSDSGDEEETACCRLPERSMDQKHALCVLLMGLLKFQDSSSIQMSAVSFILGRLH